MQIRQSGKKGRLQKQATRYRQQEDTFAKLSQHQKKSKRIETPHEFVSQTPITLKPGAVSTLLILGMIGSTMVPRASGALIPHKGELAKGLDEVSKLATEKTYDWYGVKQVSCPEVTKSFTEAVRKHPTSLQRMLTVLKDPAVKISCNTGESWSHAQDGKNGGGLMNNDNPKDKRIVINQEGMETTKLLRTMRLTENYILHTTKKCFNTLFNKAISPVYPGATKNFEEFNAALNMGDARILRFNDLLKRYQSLEMASPYQINAELGAGERILNGLNKLVVRHRSPAINAMSDDEITLLDRYLAASRNCMLKPVTLEFGLEAYNEIKVQNTNVFHTVLHGNTSAFVSVGDTRIVNGMVRMETRYAYAFESVANHVFHIQRFLGSFSTPNTEPARLLAARESETIATLSPEAIEVFYPELKELMQREEARCAITDEERMKMEL